jgi:transcriptional regulator with XRE-family HTH domain
MVKGVNGSSSAEVVYARWGSFAAQLRKLMAERGISGNELARQVYVDPALISRFRSGKQRPSADTAGRIDEALAAGGKLAMLADAGPVVWPGGPDGSDDELAAVEFARRAAASDAGEATVSRLERAVDDLATAYPGTRPVVLLGRVRAHLSYAAGLLDGRTSLAEHRRLLVSAGWMSLLVATCLVDLGRRPAALAYLRTAAQLAAETGHAEIGAWCIETQAWQVLTDGDYPRAARLSRHAQQAAPRGGSASIQATAQEGRAWARLGAKPEAYDALARTEALVARIPAPDRPEHHYQYDPVKAEAYVATTLAWLGDRAAEPHARSVLARLERPGGSELPRPRRAASARLDLALALTASDQLDEAAATTLDAVTSGLLVPSNYWRAREVISAVGQDGPGAGDLRDAYREFCRPGPRAELA